jgi:hypothetical protein
VIDNFAAFALRLWSTRYWIEYHVLKALARIRLDQTGSVVELYTSRWLESRG